MTSAATDVDSGDERCGDVKVFVLRSVARCLEAKGYPNAAAQLLGKPPQWVSLPLNLGGAGVQPRPYLLPASFDFFARYTLGV